MDDDDPIKVEEGDVVGWIMKYSTTPMANTKLESCSDGNLRIIPFAFDRVRENSQISFDGEKRYRGKAAVIVHLSQNSNMENVGKCELEFNLNTQTAIFNSMYPIKNKEDCFFRLRNLTGLTIINTLQETRR